MKPTGIILCGGHSKRMGENKALLKLGKSNLTEHVINALKPICDEIILSVNNNELDYLPYRKIKDKITDIGPIAGFHSSLFESKTEENFIISCDTPFITSSFLNYLLSNSHGYEIVLPIYNNIIQSMTGLFKKSILSTITEQMNKGNFSPINIFEKCTLNTLPITHEIFSDSDKLFFNINSIEDYKKAISIYNESKIAKD